MHDPSDATRFSHFDPHPDRPWEVPALPEASGGTPAVDNGDTGTVPDDATRIRPLSRSAKAAPPNPATSGAPSPNGLPTLKGRFRLERLLASGGMGRVYRARDLLKIEAGDHEPDLAVKVLHEDFRSHPEAWIALQRETKRAQQLAHPNIVTVYDFDRDGDEVFMTMELLEGESLADFLCCHAAPLNFDRAFAIVEGIGNALGYAHRKGIVHSDMKPGNVFLTRTGDVKVLDFGIARVMRAQSADEFDAAAFGALSPAYASCEIIENRPPDPRDDIYALACIAYQLLAGRHPFGKAPADEARDKGLTPARLTALKPRQWRALVRGLAFEREARSASVEEFLHGLRPWRLSVRTKRALALGAVIVTAAGGVEGYREFAHLRAEREGFALLAPFDRATGATPELLALAEPAHRALASEPLAGLDSVQIHAGELAERFLLQQGEAALHGDWAAAENGLRLAEALNVDLRFANQLLEARADLESAKARGAASTVTAESAGPEESQDAGDPRRQVLALAKGFAKLPMSLSQPVYYAAQPIGLTLETPVSGALHVFHLTPDGKARLLFPNAVSRDYRVAPGLLRLPKSPHVEFSAGHALGKSVLLAVLDRRPDAANLYERNRGPGEGLLTELSTDEVLEFLRDGSGVAGMQAGATEMQVCAEGGPCDWEP